MSQVLLTGMEENVIFDKKYVNYEVLENGKVQATFDDQTSVVCDLLIGADGPSSNVRKQYLPEAKLEDCGISGVAAKVPITEETKRLLPEDVLNGIGLVFAPNG